MEKLLENAPFLYLITFVFSLILSVILTPLMRIIAIKFDVMDHPHSDVKTHKVPTPYLGGLAIWGSLMLSLLLIRLLTHFPTGTLHSLRGIVLGSTVMLLLGLVDDLLPKGLGFKKKFLIQMLAALLLIVFDIRMHFISPFLMAVLLSMVWIVGISNSFNIIDIMDGLSSSLALIASLAFLFIALPTEQVYVNFCAAGLAGACLGFIPFNLSKKNKIFMGDTGSLSIGFILAALSMGTSYTKLNEVGLFAPLLILAIPIYDTLLVSFFRLQKGQSPFLGSKDHFALRLEISGFSRKQILYLTCAISAFLSFVAFMITRFSLLWALICFFSVLIIAFFVSHKLGKVEVD